MGGGTTEKNNKTRSLVHGLRGIVCGFESSFVLRYNVLTMGVYSMSLSVDAKPGPSAIATTLLNPAHRMWRVQTSLRTPAEFPHD